MKINSRSLLKEGNKFSLDLFKEPFCSNELPRFKRYETIGEFKNKIFWKKNNNFNESGQVLFLSGPARNGNHLLMSLLDGHSKILSQPGEDFMLREFLSRVKEDENLAIKELTGKNNIEYILQMSGGKFDKWKQLNEYNLNNTKSKLWSGQQPENEGHVTDFQDIVPKINYDSFKDYLYSKQKDIQSIDNFFDFFLIYLKSLQYLVGKQDYKEFKYPYLWVFSGLRRELFFLFERTDNVKCVTPIRRFETFYHSYARSRFNTEEVEQDVLDELWEHWRHKTIDYLLLKKKYPSKINFIRFENLVQNTYKTIESVCKSLDIKIEKISTIPTTLGEKNKGNSSFAKTNNFKGKVFSEPLRSKFENKVKLPNEYFEILDLLDQYAIDKK